MSSCSDFAYVIASVLLILFICIINKNPPAIFNVYQRPNGFYPLKVAFIFTLLSLRKLINKIKSFKENPSELEARLDQPQPLSSHSSPIDAVYFNGANKSGDHLVVGTARRGSKLVDGFFYLLVESSGLGLLESPKLPGTALYKTEESDEFCVEGIGLTPVVSMKKWRISYEGTMKCHGNRDKVVEVKVEAEWTSELPFFNFDTDMNAWAMAKSMAFEKFSREYFRNLEASHQTHYEQHGDVKGTATIDGEVFTIDINAVRDHSFGNHREWRNFHRYGLHFLAAENGDRFNVGMICMPINFSRLTLGYVYCAEDKKIHAVSSCDLQLYQHGEDGEPPLDYAFSFEAGGRKYAMQVNVQHSPHFYISKDWESKVVERLCTFKINGVKGWGAAEWQYRNTQGKKVKDYNGD